MESPIRLETPRLVLREFAQSDFDQVHQYGSSETVTKYQLWGPNTEDDTREFLERSIAEANELPRTSFQFAIVRKSDDRLIGACGLIIENAASREAEFGYTLNSELWGHGYATEASLALLRLGFDDLGLFTLDSGS